MALKEISVHCIAQTRVNHVEVNKWLTTIGGVEVADGVLKQIEDQSVRDAEGLVGLCGKRCYNSFVPGLNPNVTKVRESWVEYIDNVLKQGHGSVLEHATWTWAIEGCTRVMTAEANRHRAGVAISEASMRYIRFEDEGIPMWMPFSIRPTEGDDADLDRKKRITRQSFERIIDVIGAEYRYLVGEQVWDVDHMANFAQKKAVTSMLRRIVPMGVSTGAVYTINARALRHIFTMRCSPAAEEEIALAFGMIACEMFNQEKALFGDFALTPDGFRVPKYVKV